MWQIALLLLGACAVAGAPLPHPRLILTPSRRAAIAQGVSAGDSAALAFLRATEAQAAYVLTQPFPTFALIGPRLISETVSSLECVGVQLSARELAWLNLERETL